MNVFEKRFANAVIALRETRHPESFRMGDYGNADMTSGFFRTKEADSCGTPYCVLGNYAFRTDLQRSFDLWKGGLCVGRTVVRYDGAEVMAHFGITEEEANDLFGPSGCNDAQSPEEAIEYIEAFVAKKWPAKELDPAYKAMRSNLVGA